MNSEKVTELLKQLRIELNNNRDEMDSETEQQLIQMDADIHQILQSNDMQTTGFIPRYHADGIWFFDQTPRCLKYHA